MPTRQVLFAYPCYDGIFLFTVDPGRVSGEGVTGKSTGGHAVPNPRKKALLRTQAGSSQPLLSPISLPLAFVSIKYEI